MAVVATVLPGLAACGGSETDAPTFPEVQEGIQVSPDPPPTGDENSSHAPGGATAEDLPVESGTDAARDGPTPAPRNALSPVASGVYEYDTAGETTTSGAIQRTEDLPERTTLTVDRPVRDRQRFIRDLRNEAGNGSVTETILHYQDSGAALEHLHLSFEEGGAVLSWEFEFNPPQLVAPAGMEVGHRLEFSATSTDGGLELDMTVEVLGTETVTVGDQEVETLLVETRAAFRGDAEGTRVSHEHLAPARSLIVREDVTLDAQLGFAERHTQYTATLRSLHPGAMP